MRAGTLVPDNQSVGRRNWTKCKEFKDVQETDAQLFQNDCVTPAALSELSSRQEAIHPAVAACITQLMNEHKQGEEGQEQLDAYLFISLLPIEMQHLFMSKIKVLPSHLLHTDQVDDIGYIVRDILLFKKRMSILSKIYHFTMPFIKHNRLNFPAMRFVSKTVLMHLIQVIFITCLGLQPSASKQPTWSIRRKLFIFFSNLLTRGSLRDIFLFCEAHTYLLRLSLMEHFMNFVNSKMTQEIRLMQLPYDLCKIHRLVQYISDSFRMTSLQNDDLDWEQVETKAQLCVERCNRSCKSHTHKISVQRTNVSHTMDAEMFRRVLSLPILKMSDAAYSSREYDMFVNAARWTMCKTVMKFPLPISFQLQQFKHMQQNSYKSYNGSVVACSLLYSCLRCNLTTPESKTHMRIYYPHLPICTHCNSNEYMCVVDTLGHLVQIYEHYHYFCVSCNRVHIWTGCGSEMFTCTQGTDNTQECERRKCAVCVRSICLQKVYVFDKKLGVMQTVFLCSKHCPPSAQMQYVHDVTSLHCLVNHLG